MLWWLWCFASPSVIACGARTRWMRRVKSDALNERRAEDYHHHHHHWCRETNTDMAMGSESESPHDCLRKTLYMCYHLCLCGALGTCWNTVLWSGRTCCFWSSREFNELLPLTAIHKHPLTRLLLYSLHYILCTRHAVISYVCICCWDWFVLTCDFLREGFQRCTRSHECKHNQCTHTYLTK